MDTLMDNTAHRLIVRTRANLEVGDTLNIRIGKSHVDFQCVFVVNSSGDEILARFVAVDRLKHPNA